LLLAFGFWLLCFDFSKIVCVESRRGQGEGGWR
jgi:hypothetical protein